MMRRRRFHSVLIVFLTLMMVVPIDRLTLFPLNTARATVENYQAGENGTCPCPPYPDEIAASTQGKPDVAATVAPVFLYRGTAVEANQDLSLPGPVFGWSHTRTYDSRMYATGGGEVPAYSGASWFSDVTGPYLVPNPDSSDNVDLITTASTRLTFNGPPDSGNYVPPLGWRVTFRVDTNVDDELDYDDDSVTDDSDPIDVFTLTFVDSGSIYKFLGFSAGIPAALRGRLVEKTSRSYVAQELIGVRYHYTGTGLVDYVVSAEPQEWTIDYDYSGALPQLSRISVMNGSSSEIAYAEYTYHSAGTSDRGSTGDLIQAKIGHQVAGGWTTRTTHYRYYHSGSSDGKDHQLKFVFEPDALARIMAAGDTDVDTLAEILAADDSEAVNGDELKDYATRAFTYYIGNENTTTADTPFAQDNLESAYGGTNINEFDGSFGFVKTETVQGACASCGSSGGNVTHTYHYMASHGNSANINEVARIVVEDTVDGEDDPVHRKVYGLNFRSSALREALIENPDASPLKAWCTSIKLDGYGLIGERRMPSAHTIVEDNTDLATFLNPYASSSWSNDSATLNDDSGVIYVYRYLDGSNYRIYDEMVKEGEGGTAYFTTATDYGYGSDDEPEFVPIKTYTYREATELTDRSTGIATDYAYDFWDGDDKQLKKMTVTLPEVDDATENGSGVRTTTETYWDKFGRRRWTKDGEGYVNYFSYHPKTGELAYIGIDVDPSSMPGDATTESTKRVSAGDDGSGSYSSGKPSRSGTQTKTDLVTKFEFDDLGRTTIEIEPGGAKHFTRYEVNKTLRFPYLVTDAGSGSYGKPQLPVKVSTTNAGGTLTATYTIDPAQATASGGLPTGVNDNDDYYQSLTQYGYDPIKGRPISVTRFHDIGGNGSYTTSYLYDNRGRRSATVEFVATGKYQVTLTLFDTLSRIVKTYRDAVSSEPSNYASLFDAMTGQPISAFGKIGELQYDDGNVGDSHVTKSTQYNDLTVGSYTMLNFHRTFRGHTRGIERQYYDGSSTADVTPYTALDIDWMGRTTGSAFYTSSEPNWSTLKAGYSGYLSSNSSGRNEWSKKYYDVMGRVYRTEHHPGSEATKHFQTNNYYDRNDQLVATGQLYSAQTEFAYDGAGRRFQERVIQDISSPAYSSGAFQHVLPLPTVAFGSMSSGNGGVIELEHSGFNSGGNNVIELHTVELNHDDTNGFSLSSGTPSGGVRTTIHNYYDTADRLITVADYGAADDNDGNVAWQASGLPTRDGGTSTSFTSSADRLITQYAYEADSGRLSIITDPQGMKTKTYYDDLGRRTAVAENQDNYDGPGDESDAGGGTNHEKDRVTTFAYNGLGRQTKLTAINVASSTVNQETKYYYEDIHNAALVTHTVYPDSSSAPSSGTDWVKLDYNIDGTLKKKTDQREVEIEYEYDSARRLNKQMVTDFGPSAIVDESVKSIVHTYDSLGRFDKITSYANDDGSGTVRNQVAYLYTGSKVSASYQSHENAATGGSPTVSYVYDTSTDGSNIYDDGFRLVTMTTPNGKQVSHGYGSTGTSTDVNDRLNRVNQLYSTVITNYVGEYEYNGINRLVAVDFRVPDLRLQMYDIGSAGANVYNGFDRFGRTVDHYWYDYTSGTADRDRIKYGYDYTGNRTWHEDVVASSAYSKDFDEFYTFDGLQRLKTADRGSLTGSPTYTGVTSKNFAQEWTLDQLGNWPTFKQDDDGMGWDLTQTRTHNSVNEIDTDNDHTNGPGASITASPGANWADPAYDAAGNMTAMPKPADLANAFTLKYDAWNRLVEIKNGGSTVQTNEYDGLGRRVQKVVGGTTTEFYYNEKWQLVHEGAAGSNANLYIWHPYYIDALAVRFNTTNGSSYTSYYHLHDDNYNVTAVTNSSGTVQERYAYTPYGEVTVLDDNFGPDANGITDIGSTHFYTGRELDSETGLQLNRYRFYASHLGRWVSRDPIGYSADDLSLYQYVAGNPTRLLDPYGEVPVDCVCEMVRVEPPFAPELKRFSITVECPGLGEKCCEKACAQEATNWEYSESHVVSWDVNPNGPWFIGYQPPVSKYATGIPGGGLFGVPGKSPSPGGIRNALKYIQKMLGKKPKGMPGRRPSYEGLEHKGVKGAGGGNPETVRTPDPCPVKPPDTVIVGPPTPGIVEPPTPGIVVPPTPDK